MSPPVSRPERQKSSNKKKHRRQLIGAFATVVILLAGAVVFFTARGDDQKPVVAKSATTTTTTTKSAFKPFTIATTTGGPLDAYLEPSTSAAKITQLSAKTEYNLTRTVLVTEQRDGWIKALLPMRPDETEGWIPSAMRPNEIEGWIPLASVTLSTTNYEIEINLTAYTLVLKDSGKSVFEASVALGNSKTPTPPGRYYITDPIDLTKKLDPIYGAYALGISGYSEVLKSFRGGPGQLAIHGGAWESMLGTNPSNGCIRMLNDQVVELAGKVPIGTPVTITA